jgi:hypothetical protein
MRGIGKSLALMAAVPVFVCGLVMLLSTEASAQFNIDGLIRGAIGHGGYGGGYRSRSSGHHTSSRSSSHSKHEDDDASADKAPDKGKEKDATQVEAPNNNTATHPQPSGPVQNASRSSEPDPTAKPSGGGSAGGGNKAYDDQPAFAPSR